MNNPLFEDEVSAGLREINSVYLQMNSLLNKILHNLYRVSGVTSQMQVKGVNFFSGQLSIFHDSSPVSSQTNNPVCAAYILERELKYSILLNWLLEQLMLLP